MAANLSAPVKDGVVEQYQSTITQSKKKRGTSELGKDAFLQLLVTQMQYQDPLNPSSDTEFISQLASFSSLEQMQNLNGTFSKAQAFSLIGQEVRVTADNKAGYVQGTVDYVTVSNGTSYFSIDGTLYASDKLITVIDPYFIAKQNAPTIAEQNFSYDHENPTDVKVKIDLGKETGAASSFAVLLNGSVVDTKYMVYDEKTSTVTISKEAFAGLEEGSYKVMFLFNDQLETTITDQVVVKVTGTPEKTEETDKEEADKEEETDKESAEKDSGYLKA